MSLDEGEYEEVHARKHEAEDGGGGVLLRPVVPADDKVEPEHGEQDGELNQPRNFIQKGSSSDILGYNFGSSHH